MLLLLSKWIDKSKELTSVEKFAQYRKKRFLCFQKDVGFPNRWQALGKSSALTTNNREAANIELQLSLCKQAQQNSCLERKEQVEKSKRQDDMLLVNNDETQTEKQMTETKLEL